MLKNKTAEFIEKAIKIHGDRYSYGNVNYVNSHRGRVVLNALIKMSQLKNSLIRQDWFMVTSMIIQKSSIQRTARKCVLFAQSTVNSGKHRMTI